jgi:hypothetical protein
MKKILALIIIVASSVTCFSQIEFENGYYINLNGEKMAAQIKNEDWKYNPTEFEFRLNEDSEIQVMTAEKVLEFGIGTQLKYISADVNIDRSPALSEFRNPDFRQERLFLKVVVEGSISLLSYANTSYERYFYVQEGQLPIQLIYKKFESIDERIVENQEYKKQISELLTCSDITTPLILSTSYGRNSLDKLFCRYNECVGSQYTNYYEYRTRSQFHFRVKPGMRFSTFSIVNLTDSWRDTDFENKLLFRIGVEAEVVLPYKKNKWAFYSDPAFQYYSSEVLTGIYPKKVDYKSIEIPLGIKHYFFLNENSKIHLSGSIVYDYILNDAFVLVEYRQELVMANTFNVRTGIGFNYNEFCVELNYDFRRNALGLYSSWYSDFHPITLNLSYTIL